MPRILTRAGHVRAMHRDNEAPIQPDSSVSGPSSSWTRPTTLRPPTAPAPERANPSRLGISLALKRSAAALRPRRVLRASSVRGHASVSRRSGPPRWREGTDKRRDPRGSAPREGPAAAPVPKHLRIKGLGLTLHGWIPGGGRACAQRGSGRDPNRISVTAPPPVRQTNSAWCECCRISSLDLDPAAGPGL